MFKKIAHIAVQVVILSVLAWAGDAFMDLLGLKLPGSIFMMLVLFVLLKTRIVRLEWFDVGADWLHSRLVLFFVPSAVGVAQYGAFIRTEGLRLFAVILLGTLSVMAVAGLLAERLDRQGKEVGHEQ